MMSFRKIASYTACGMILGLMLGFSTADAKLEDGTTKGLLSIAPGVEKKAYTELDPADKAYADSKIGEFVAELQKSPQYSDFLASHHINELDPAALYEVLFSYNIQIGTQPLVALNRYLNAKRLLEETQGKMVYKGALQKVTGINLTMSKSFIELRSALADTDQGGEIADKFAAKIRAIGNFLHNVTNEGNQEIRKVGSKDLKLQADRSIQIAREARDLASVFVLEIYKNSLEVIDQQAGQADALIAQSQGLERQLTAMQDAMAELQENMSNELQKKAKALSANAELQARVQELMSKIKANNSNIDRLNFELAKAQKDLHVAYKEQARKLRQLEREKDEERDNVVKAVSELAVEQKQISDAQILALNNDISALNDQISALNKQVSEKNKQLSDERYAHQQDVRADNARIDRLNFELREAQRYLNVANKERDRKLRQLTREKDEEKDNTVAAIQKQMDGLRMQIEEAGAQNVQLAAEFQKAIADKENTITAQAANILAQTQMLNNLNQQIQDLTEQMVENSNKTQSLYDQFIKVNAIMLCDGYADFVAAEGVSPEEFQQVIAKMYCDEILETAQKCSTQEINVSAFWTGIAKEVVRKEVSRSLAPAVRKPLADYILSRVPAPVVNQAEVAAQ